jgi:SAM-dependent methyltransferase
MMSRRPPAFPVNRLADGRALVNLGSSARVAPGWNNVDFSLLVRLARYQRLCGLLHRRGLISKDRYDRIRRVDPASVTCWDLRRGIPFASETFDVVYHSHVLEHIDREGAPGFLRECRRVLRPGGTLRVVVPDLESLTRRYLAVVDRLPESATDAEHRFATEQIFDQMIVRTPRLRAQQPRVMRILENVFIGDTARSGVLHRWMYDRFSLGALLREVGFADVAQFDAQTSRVEGWSSFHLDTNPDGSIYKPGSLYMEGRRA